MIVKKLFFPVSTIFSVSTISWHVVELRLVPDTSWQSKWSWQYLGGEANLLTIS